MSLLNNIVAYHTAIGKSKLVFHPEIKLRAEEGNQTYWIDNLFTVRDTYMVTISTLNDSYKRTLDKCNDQEKAALFYRLEQMAKAKGIQLKVVKNVLNESATN